MSVGQVCAYCLKPFESRMIPVTFHSRHSVNSQMWFHVHCMKAAFAGAAAPLAQHLEDWTVDLRTKPSA
jgi:hypothetical protein